MEEITKEHQLVVRKLKTMLDDSIKAIRKAFVTHLNSKDVKKAISQWKKEDLPMLKSGDTWYEFEDNIFDAVQATLNRIVYRWEQTSNIFAKRQDALISVFDDHFNQLECKLRNAQLMIEGRSPTRHDTAMTHESIKVEDLLATVQDFHSILLADTSIKHRVPAGIMSQVTLPFFFMRDVFSEMKGTSKATAEQLQQQKTMDSFRKKPEKFLQDTMQRVIENIKSSKEIDVFIKNRLGGVLTKMAEIEAAIPSALQDEANLMMSLTRDDRTEIMIANEVSPVVRFLEEKVDMLADFANVYTHSADFDEKEITVDGRATHWQGLWAHYTVATLKTGQPICIKTNTEKQEVAIAEELEIWR